MPTNTTPTRFGASALAAAVTALVLAFAGLTVAAPASAHDEFISSDPAADAALEELPAQLTLTFSGALAADPGATELQVTDAGGTSLTDGDPVVEGTTVTQALTGAASGVVTVLWKVVSSDGHPISGEFDFTVTAPPAPTPTPSASPTASASASPTAEPTPTPTETPVSAASDSTLADVWPWIVGGVLVAGVGGAVVYLLASRARRKRDEEALRASAAHAAAGGPASAADPHSPPSPDR
jgi:methionine-rich copper-binding protein CopC